MADPEDVPSLKGEEEYITLDDEQASTEQAGLRVYALLQSCFAVCEKLLFCTDTGGWGTHRCRAHH